MPAKLTQEEAQLRIDKKHGKGNIIIVGEYKNTYINCQFNDTRCNHSTWTVNASYIIHGKGSGCPKCKNC